MQQIDQIRFVEVILWFFMHVNVVIEVFCSFAEAAIECFCTDCANIPVTVKLRNTLQVTLEICYQAEFHNNIPTNMQDFHHYP